MIASPPANSIRSVSYPRQYYIIYDGTGDAWAKRDRARRTADSDERQKRWDGRQATSEAVWMASRKLRSRR